MMSKNLGLFLMLFVVSCASSNCILKDKKKVNLNKKIREAFMPEDNKDRLLVYKFDGSKQCGLGKTLSLDEMSKELTDIKIHNKFKKNDGLLRVQSCGSPTGEANIYEIDKINFKSVEKLGYKIWSGPSVEN